MVYYGFHSRGIVVAKPSIFSKDYEKSIKKRRRRITTLIVTIVIIISMIIYINFFGNKNLSIMNKINTKFAKNKTENKSKQSNNINSQNKQTKNNKAKNEKEVNKQNDKQQEEKYLNLELNKNLNLKITYEEKEGKKIYKAVINSKDNSSVYHDFSPSKTSLIVLDEKEQKMYFVDNNGNINDISKEQYVSKKGTIFKRENKLKSDEKYIWCQMPRFIDENNIVFISQLPWLSDNNKKFIWYGNIQDKKYRYVLGKQGNSIEFQNLSEKGLAVSIDSDIYYLKINGQISK